MASVHGMRLLRQPQRSLATFKGALAGPLPPSIAAKALFSTATSISRRSGTVPRSCKQSALFHSSSKRSILPALPQRIEGTSNEPVRIHEPNAVHGSYHWTFERLVSVGLIPLTIAPFAAGSLNPLMDAILCGTILLHSHVGFQSVIIDYIPEKRLPRVRQMFWWGLRAATVLVGVGLYQFETNDVGVTEALKKIWQA